MVRKLLIASLLMLAFITTASAQLVKNPSTVYFKVSTDHASVTSYEMDIKRVSDDTLIQVINLGLPTPNATGEASVAINVQPVAFGTYYVVLRAVAGTVRSENSEPSNHWERVPGKPSSPRMQ